MTGLVLKLAPKERILINGAVIENGDRRGKLHILSPEVNILRLRDAIHPADAETPVTRLCYIVQLVLAGEMDPAAGRDEMFAGLEALRVIFATGPESDVIRAARRALIEGRTYFVLKHLKTLIPTEAALLRNSPVPDLMSDENQQIVAPISATTDGKPLGQN